jgi:2-polyprenyl-3-methyl-5-hydroxy-6-metoxy-1,4-benzoquinol methylase
MRNNVRELLTIIDSSIDWSTKNVDHPTCIKLLLDTRRRQTLLEAIKSNYWPTAVPPTMIVKTADERRKRAAAIISNFITMNVEGKKVLDFGCGPGDCVHALTGHKAQAVGYDIVPYDDWDNCKGTFTTDFEACLRHGPFDVVLIYDVFDHLQDDPTSIMAAIRTALKPDCHLYVRMHPYSSRHGSHQYTTFNKAYAHLFLTGEELKDVGVELVPPVKVIWPRLTYPAMLTTMGFEIETQTPILLRPEAVVEAVIPFISHLWDKPSAPANHEQIVDSLSVQFIDFVLVSPPTLAS